jgi:hypothetical protein
MPYVQLDGNNNIVAVYAIPQSFTVNLDPTSPQWLAYELAQAQAAQIAALEAAYTNAIAQPVAYKSVGGITKTFSATPQAISNVANMQLAFAPPNALPQGFYWVATDNTQVPFTYADIQGLAAALGTQGWNSFAHLQTQIAAVMAAPTAAAVQSINW